MVPANAAPLRCEGVLVPSVEEVLNFLDHDQHHFLFQGQNFANYSKSLPWLRQRKIRKIVGSLKLESLPSEQALVRSSAELSAALFGRRDIVDRWLRNSPEERLEESTVLLIKEQLLQEGLLQAWNQSRLPPEQIPTYKKLLDLLQRLQNHPAGQLLKLPFVLPALQDTRLSPELMGKIVLDGFSAHAEEARVALKKQSRIEAYQSFRKIYTPVALGLMLIVNYQLASQELERQKEEQVRQTLDELRRQREVLSTQLPHLKQELFERAYEQAVQEFSEKWGEPPTPTEEAELKTKISRALNLN